MSKILKKYTTIPPELYVIRGADKQLKRIIEEMQRPGYVLVARQMGKTNLLFNAKRTLESENKLFVYVDMSTLFNRERDCYRSIIDNIIEPNDLLFETILQDLYDIRKQELPSHKEYLKSLRIILEKFRGDIVIILDEIDALKSVNYSDNIFSQIRSNYFSRTNFPEFERLTYILSGVIEPIDLIKDRNKSPFNIGEKIYLDDFTELEHDDFINKSGLQIKDEIKDEIYSWTNGNPRLTFDICSEVENFLSENGNISTEELKNLIQKKYLTTFDIPPVDHIRELVKSDKKVRNTVLNIQIGKTDNIPDEIKTKLYLYGIINSKFDEVTVIKNRIIQLSITADWIKAIDKQNQDNYTYGLQKRDELQYADAIELLSEYINNSNATKSQIEVCNYNIAFSYYKLRNLKKAIEYFSKDYTTSFGRSAKSFLGICKIGVGDKENGISILEEVIKTKKNDFPYRNAVLNLVPQIVSADKEYALDLCSELYKLTFIEGEDISEDELNKIRTLAQYYQAEIYIKNKGNKKGAEHISFALEHASLSDSLYLKLLKYSITETDYELIKTEIIEVIINNKLKFDSINKYPISFCEVHLHYYLDLIFNLDNLELFEKLLNYAITEIYENKIDRFHLLYELSWNSVKKVDILNYLLYFKEKIDMNLLINIYRDLSFVNIEKYSKFLEYFGKYKMLFEESKVIKIADIQLFTIAIRHYSEIEKFNEGLELCEIIRNRVESTNELDLKFESVIIYYWSSVLNSLIKNKSNAIQYADKTIHLIKESENKTNSIIDEKGLKAILDQVKDIKNSFANKVPVVNEFKYGRNERIKVEYLNGKIVEDKYKKFESDILAEKCKII